MEPYFKFLDHPLIPKTNNHLEGVISQTVSKLRSHRGMKLSQQVSFLKWYFAFSRVKDGQDLKKLWDVWRKENN